MLTVIQDTINLVKKNRGIDVEFDKDMNDEKVYELYGLTDEEIRVIEG